MRRLTIRIAAAALTVGAVLAPAAPAMAAGDANLDGQVDAQDFAIWRRASNTTTVVALRSR